MSNGQHVIEKNNHEMNLNLSSIIKNLVYVVIFILFFFALGQFAKFYMGFDHLLGFVPMFNLYSEANIPTWFSSIILLVASGLLLIITMAKRYQHDRYFLYWAGLSAAFLFLSVDESAKLHEAVGRVFQHIVGEFLMSGHWSMWVVPFGVFALIFAVGYLRFLFGLEPYFRNLFIISGAIYVFGALGMEVIEILYIRDPAFSSKIFMLMVTIEETMEIGGVILFIYTLLRYIQTHIGKISFELKT